MPGVLVTSWSARAPLDLPRSSTTPRSASPPLKVAVHAVALSPSRVSLAAVKSVSGRAYGLYVEAASGWSLIAASGPGDFGLGLGLAVTAGVVVVGLVVVFAGGVGLGL